MLEAAGANSHSTEMATKILIHVHPEFCSFFPSMRWRKVSRDLPPRGTTCSDRRDTYGTTCSGGTRGSEHYVLADF